MFLPLFLLMKKLITILAILSAFSVQAQYELFWSDEFDGTDLDLTKWTYDVGGHGWGNEEPQYYTENERNVDVDTGYLRITAIQEDYAGSDYTSARIKTQGLFEVKYGKVEARIKLPKDQGLWPAFWMLGSNITEVSWPKCGEIDIMEHINNSFYIHGTMHYDNWGHTSTGEDKAIEVKEFQVYAIEWDDQKIKWYVNDILYFTANIEGGVGSTEEFHEPFFLNLNLATGGLWPGYPDASTEFPASMFVDYVRVFKEVFASTDELEIDAELSIYPNPTTEWVQISGAALSDISAYSLYNLSGELVMSGSVGYGAKIDVSVLNSGCYILAVNDLQGVVRKRFRLMVG